MGLKAVLKGFIISAVALISASHCAHADSSTLPSYILERTLKGSVWCRLDLSESKYEAINTKPNSTPAANASLWSDIGESQKISFNKKITSLTKNLKKTKNTTKKKSLQKQIGDLKKKKKNLEIQLSWMKNACANATKKRSAYFPTPTPQPIATATATATPEPTPRAELTENLTTEVKQNETKNILIKTSPFKLELVFHTPQENQPKNPVDTQGFSSGCNVVANSLSCSFINGTYVGTKNISIKVKESFSDNPEDYQITTYNIEVTAQSDPASLQVLEIPSEEQLKSQFINNSGHGVRPWHKADETGLLAYARQGDERAIFLRNYVRTFITRTNGGSAILYPLPAVGDVKNEARDRLDQCLFLETSILPETVNWHVLDSNGIPVTNGSGYVLKQYTSDEMKTLILNFMVKQLTRYAEFPTWYDGNAEIGRSMTAFNYAGAYSCIKDKISEEQRLVFENALRDKYLTPTLTLLENGGWPVNRTGKVDTGNQGIEVAATLMVVSAAIMAENPEEGAHGFYKALSSLDRFLNVLYRGGSLEEGPGYHIRSFGYLILADEVLWRTFGTNFGLLSPNSAIARESSLWSYNTYGPGGYQFTFTDSRPNTPMINTSSSIPWSFGIGYYLADLFNDPQQVITEIGKLDTQGIGGTQMLYYKPYNAAQIIASTPKDYVSTGYPFFATRSDNTTEAMYLAAIGQVHGWIHNHYAPGNFVMHWKGVPFVDSLSNHDEQYINYSSVSANYWTQVARSYEVFRRGIASSNSLTLTSPINNGFVLSQGRPVGYESESDPNIVFGDEVITPSRASAVLDTTKTYTDYSSSNYATMAQQDWPLPSGRFVQRAKRHYGLDRSNPAVPWSYVCDSTQYSGTASTKISFNTPAAVSSIGGNRYRLSYTQPINSSGGTRSVSLTAHLQSTTALTVNVESLNDLPSNLSRYPSWLKALPGFQCSTNPSDPMCYSPTHLPNMSRVHISTSGVAAKVCVVFAPDGFTPPNMLSEIP